jgi:hypothetical protein
MKLGASTMTGSPGEMSSFPMKSKPCCEPPTSMMFSGSHGTPRVAM